MKAIDRIKAAANFSEYDRPAFDFFEEAGYLFPNGKYTPSRRLWMDYNEQVDARIKFQKRFNTDLIFDIPVLIPTRIPHKVTLFYKDKKLSTPSPLYSSVSAMAWNAMPPKLKGDGLLDDGLTGLVVKKVIWDNGLESEEALDLETGTSDVTQPVFSQAEDIIKHIDCLKGDLTKADFSYLYRIRKAVGNDIALSGTVIDPVSAIGWYLGIESLMYMIFDNPVVLKTICDELCNICLETSVAMIKNGMDMIRLGAATACLFSPDIFLEFCAPYQQRICNAVREAGGMTHLHMCGNVKTLMEPILSSKADILETLTPPPLGNTTMLEAKKTIGQKICLKGNLSPTGALRDGSPTEALEEAKKCLQEGMPGGAFIFSVADNLASGTPEENIAAIAEYITSL